MNNKNCYLCKHYKNEYCENLELRPQHPSTGCDYFEKCEDYIAIPVNLIKNMCEALSEYELSDKDCFSKIHDACVDIDAFCRDKLSVRCSVTMKWKCERCRKLMPYMAVFCNDCANELLGEAPKPFKPPIENNDVCCKGEI